MVWRTVCTTSTLVEEGANERVVVLWHCEHWGIGDEEGGGGGGEPVRRKGGREEYIVYQSDAVVG